MESNHLRVSSLAMLLATLVFNCPAAVLYVDVNSPGPAPPFAGWSTAATNIQDAIDVSSAGDNILVTNGVYRFGGRIVYGTLTNRVAVTKAVSVQSIGGPLVTTILGGYGQGDISARCAYLTNGASLQGFTLLNGGTRAFATDNETRGGGVFCESTDAIVTDCILATNTAFTGGGGAYGGTFNNCRFTNNSAGGGQYGAIGGGAVSATLNTCTLVSNFGNGGGGGASSCTLSNCLLLGNTSWGGGAGASNCVLSGCMILTNTCIVTGAGGGANSCTLRNCTVIGNTALGGSGAIYSTLVNCTVTANQGVGAETCYVTNCILFYNLDGNYGFNGYLTNATISYSCTTPLPPTGTGNFTNNPLLASWSHMSAASPCRGAGLALAAQGTDIDGESWANPPSIGCDEFIPGGATGPLAVEVDASRPILHQATTFPSQVRLRGGRRQAFGTSAMEQS